MDPAAADGAAAGDADREHPQDAGATRRLEGFSRAADAGRRRPPEPADAPRRGAAAAAGSRRRRQRRGDDLPAPVSTTRPFTLPRITAGPRIAGADADRTRADLENSAELDLPHLSEMSMVTARTISRSDDVEVDLADIKLPTPASRGPAGRAAGAPAAAAAAVPAPLTVVMTHDGAGAGSRWPTSAWSGCSRRWCVGWWFYYSRAQEVSLVAGRLHRPRRCSPTRRRSASVTSGWPALFDDDIDRGLPRRRWRSPEQDRRPARAGRGGAADPPALRARSGCARPRPRRGRLTHRRAREPSARADPGLAAIAERRTRPLAQRLLAAAGEPGVRALPRAAGARPPATRRPRPDHASEATVLTAR